jgi:N-acetylglucosamine-6-sulfatase
MLRRWAICAAVALGLAASATSAAAARAPAASPAAGAAAGRPNIVFVLADDQPWNSLWAQPNVQRLLVAHGVKFTNAFVNNSLCCPSRASILTGLTSGHTGVWANSPAGGFGSFDDSSTIATWLAASGYQTALVGKYLNGYCDAQALYTPPGWSAWFAFTSDCGQGAYYDYTVSDNGTLRSFGSARADYEQNVLTRRAVTWLANADPSRPVFLYFAPKGPHYPATPAQGHASAFSTLAPYRPPNFNEPDVSDKPAYVQAWPLLNAGDVAAVTAFRQNVLRADLSLDDAVKALVDELAATGRLQNTMFVYMSDNGQLFGEHRWRGKQVPYNESLRVPLVIRYDPLTAGGPRTDPHIALNLDLAPTWAALAGVSPPSPRDGRSLLPLLGGGAPAWRQDLLAEHKQEGPGIPSFCAVRSLRYLYVQYATGEEELYDERADPYELTNLAGHPALAAVLTDRRTRDHVLCDPVPPGFAWSH